MKEWEEGRGGQKGTRKEGRGKRGEKRIHVIFHFRTEYQTESGLLGSSNNNNK